MRLMVLGGAGYVGSAFVVNALDHNHEILVYDNLQRGHRSLVPTELGVKLVEADVLDVSAIAATLNDFRPDAVLHYAAYALVPESVRCPTMYYRNNVGGVIGLFEAIAASKWRGPVVFSSTCAIFGTPDQVPIREDAPKKPESPYGASKLMAEQIIKDAATELSIPAVALRYFNACGADPKCRVGEDHDPETHLIPNILIAAAENRPIKIFGNDYPTPDGTCVRDYIHVTDLADAHLLAIERMLASKSWSFEAIHIGTGKGFSNLEILAAVERGIGRPIPREMQPRRPGDAERIFADTKKAQTLLGFTPKYSDLDTIVTTAYQWHQKRFARSK